MSGEIGRDVSAGLCTVVPFVLDRVDHDNPNVVRARQDIE